MKLKILNILPFDSSESDNALWEIAQVTLKDEGYYECIAISSAGTGRARTFLDVSGKHKTHSPCHSLIIGNLFYLFGDLLVMQ